MRILFAATAILLLAAAPAQRINTRTINITTRDGRTQCNLQAHPDLLLTYADQGRDPVAYLREPVTPRDPGLDVRLGMQFNRGSADDRHTVAASAIGLQIVPGGGTVPAITAGRLFIDGKASAVPLTIGHNARQPNALYLDFPANRRREVGAMMVSARWVEFRLTGSGGKVLRTYKWDGLRIDEMTETLTIIDWRCAAPPPGPHQT